MRRNALCVLCSVVLLSVGWLGLSGITLLVALIPLLHVSEQYSDSQRDWWRMAGWATLTFVLWNISTVWWIWNATPIGPVAATMVSTSSVTEAELPIPCHTHLQAASMLQEIF